MSSGPLECHACGTERACGIGTNPGFCAWLGAIGSKIPAGSTLCSPAALGGMFGIAGGSGCCEGPFEKSAAGEVIVHMLLL